MSSVETTDFVSSDHFLGSPLKIDTIAKQLAELCPACVEGATKGKQAGSTPAPFVAVLVSSSQRGAQVHKLLKEASKGNTVVKAYESHSKVKKLLSKFLASDAALGTRIIIATAGR
jgi:hypothetical protein